MPTPRVSWLMLVAILAAQTAHTAPRDPGSPPDADFLEFLGSWATSDEKWADPFQKDEMPIVETNDRESELRERDYRNRLRKKRFDSDRAPSQTEPESSLPLKDVRP